MFLKLVINLSISVYASSCVVIVHPCFVVHASIQEKCPLCKMRFITGECRNVGQAGSLTNWLGGLTTRPTFFLKKL
jgi:hypothetical protein